MSAPTWSILSLWLVLLSPGQLVAQTHIVSPPGFANKTGGARSWGVAAYPNGRSQLADGMYRNQAMTLKGISFRLTSPTTGYWNPGRSFSTVSLRMAETDIPKMTGSYNTNVVTTPTLVFQKPVTLPLVTGPHRSVPAPWSLHFPFATNWAYTGAKDILADFEFRGGKLSNGRRWTTNPNAYLWDAAAGSPWAYGLTTEIGNTGPKGCIDSASPIKTLSGRALMTVVNRNPKDPFHPLAGRLVIEQSGNSFGANAPAVTVLGFQPLPSGVPLPGVGCNRIHVGTALPILVTPVVANSIGRLPTHHSATGPNGIPTLPSYIGVPVIVQGAWNDTRNGNLLLSSAATTKVPALPKLYDLAGVHGPNTVSGTPSVDASSNHIRRYTR